MPSHKISCIISAYNEESNLEATLNSIINHPLLEEIVVVNDASTDQTLNILQSFNSKRLNIISHHYNLGKSAAIKSGLKHVKNKFVLLLDADIPNITAASINSLTKPIINGKFDVAIALIGDRLQRLFKIDILSGIRCTTKDILVNFLDLYQPEGYEFEVLFNKYLLENKLSFCFIDWTNSYFKYSTEKYGRISGTKRIIAKRLAIYKKIGFVNFYLQYAKMFFRKNKFHQNYRAQNANL